MKFFLLTVLVASCSAVVLPTTGRKILWDQDTALIHGLTGSQYMFKQYPGQKFVEIVLNGINTPMKKIQIDGETCRVVNLEGFPRMAKTLPNTESFMMQSAIQPGYFMNILKQYAGHVDEYQYQQLLKTVRDQVKEGKVCHIIYHMLTLLDEVVNDDLIEQQFSGSFYPQQQMAGVVPAYGKQMWNEMMLTKPMMGEMTVPRTVYGYQQPWAYTNRFAGAQPVLNNYLFGKLNPTTPMMTPFTYQTGNPTRTMTPYWYNNEMMMDMMMRMPYY